jgi:hypothetical protein
MGHAHTVHGRRFVLASAATRRPSVRLLAARQSRSHSAHRDTSPARPARAVPKVDRAHGPRVRLGLGLLPRGQSWVESARVRPPAADTACGFANDGVGHSHRCRTARLRSDTASGRSRPTFAWRSAKSLEGRLPRDPTDHSFASGGRPRPSHNSDRTSSATRPHCPARRLPTAPHPGFRPEVVPCSSPRVPCLVITQRCQNPSQARWRILKNV